MANHLASPAPTSPLRKVAVDRNAAEYWEQLRGAYGKLYAKSVPRKIKAALDKEFAAFAAKTAERAKTDKSARVATAPKILSGESAALAVSKPDKVLHVEGVFRGIAEGRDGKPVRLARLFNAAFDENGELTAFRSIAAP